MKIKVIIENGETEIILTPENEFEKDILEKINLNKSKFNIQTEIQARYDFGSYRDHKLVLNIKEIK